MTLATNDIENAQREAAMDRAHSMCIDKIKQLSEDLASANRRIEELTDTANEYAIIIQSSQ